MTVPLSADLSQTACTVTFAIVADRLLISRPIAHSPGASSGPFVVSGESAEGHRSGTRTDTKPARQAYTVATQQSSVQDDRIAWHSPSTEKGATSLASRAQ